jgi:hypothetical protein
MALMLSRYQPVKRYPDAFFALIPLPPSPARRRRERFCILMPGMDDAT